MLGLLVIIELTLVIMEALEISNSQANTIISVFLKHILLILSYVSEKIYIILIYFLNAILILIKTLLDICDFYSLHRN